MRETVSDIFIAVDSLATNSSTNPINSRVLEVFPPLLFSFSYQFPAAMKSAGSNMPVPQGQDIVNSIESNLPFLAIPCDNN